MASWLRDRLNLVFLAVSAGMALVFWYKTHVVLDDAYIYFRVAENFVAGRGLVLNAGDTHLAVTSPLWTFVLAACAAAFGHTGLVAAAKFLYLLALGVAGYFAYDLARPKLGAWALAAPAAVFFNYVALTSVGGEIALVLLALTGVPWTWLRQRSLLGTGFLLGVGYLGRGELALLSVPVVSCLFWDAWRRRRSLRETLGDLLCLSGVALAPVLCWHLYYYFSFAALFPNTFTAKMVQGRSGQWMPYALDFPNQLRLAVQGHWMLYGLAFAGVVALPAAAFVALAFLALHFAAYTWLTIPNYHWYYYDLHLLVLFFALTGAAASFAWMGQSLPAQRWRYLWQGVGVSALLTVFVLATAAHRWQLPDPVEERYTSYARLAAYLNEHARDGDTLLAAEIGIVGFLVPQVVIRDINGLATPGVTERTINNWHYYLAHFRPRFLMMHRGSWPYGISAATENGTLRYLRVAEGNPQAERDKRTLLELRP